MGARFLHTADWQIGMKGSGLGEAGRRVAAQRIDTLDRVFSTAREHEVEIVLAAGDLFERNEIDTETVDAVAAIIGRHPEIQVHAIPGNHDLAGPGSVWNRDALRRLTNLHLHRDTTPVLLPGLVLHPFPVASRYAGKDPLAALPDLLADTGIHVGVAHGHLTTVTFGGHEEDIRLPIDPTQVERAGLDYLALGHWHGTRIIQTPDGRARIAYSGTHEQTSYRETEAGNVLLVEIKEKGAEPSIEPIHVGVLRWARADFAFAGDESLSRFEEMLAAHDVDFLELDVSGELPVALYPTWRDELEVASRERFLDLRLHERALRWRHDDTPIVKITDPSLQEVQGQLQSAASSAEDDEQQVLREALALFGQLVREAQP